MTTEIVHELFGTPLSEWIAHTPDELDDDAVGLWQVIPNLRKGFVLEGDALETAVRQSLHLMLARGALPVEGRNGAGGGWELVSRYAQDPDTMVNEIIAEWHQMGRDPDFGDPWFALPWFYED